MLATGSQQTTCLRQRPIPGRVALRCDGRAVLLVLAITILLNVAPALAQQPSPAALRPADPPQRAASQPAESPPHAEALEPDGGKIMTSDPFTNDPGYVSISPCFTMSTSTSYYDGQGRRRPDALVRQDFYNVSITYGLVKDWDLAIYLGDSTLHDLHNLDPEGPPGPIVGAGLTDTTVALRWKFHSSKDLSASHTFSIVIPSGSNGGPGAIGLTQGFTSLQYRISASKAWGRWSTNADLGLYAVPGHHNSTTSGSVNANVAAGYQVTSWFQPVVELNYLSTLYQASAPSQVLGITAGGMIKAGDFSFTVGAQKTLWGRNANDTVSTIFSASYGFSLGSRP